MSIISSDAKWAVIRRFVRLSPEEIRGTTKGKEYEAGFIAGATRRPTNEEIVAGAKAFYEALKPDSYPQWDSDCALRPNTTTPCDSQSRQCKERQRKNE